MTHEARTRLLSIGLATTLHAFVAAWLFGAVIAVHGGGELSPSDGQRIVMISLLKSHDAATPPASSEPMATAPSDGSGAPQRLRADYRAAPGALRASDAAPARPAPGATAGPADSPPATAAIGNATLNPAEVNLFRDRLLADIERYRQYPPEAQRGSVEGVVLLRFTMDRQGQVTAAWIGRSSGSTALDAEALAAVRRATPLPPIPAGWPAHLDVSLPIVFALG